jgi:predicted nucleic acid-binding protein
LIFLDSSVVLAYLLDQDRAPPASLWQQRTVASRLLEYEVWTRLNARALAQSHGDAAAALIRRTSLVELSPSVLARALQPFPVAVRTLDALHLATVEFLRGRGREVGLASYDERLLAGARALGIPIADL